MSNITINTLPTASTIDGTQDILPIYTASSMATQGISRNVLLGLSSAPVGLTDSQTLTNKVLNSPTISGPTLSGTIIGTYTIGGTPTFPASVVTLTGSQTLTNKILTSPTINTATISNPTLTVDTVSGYTTAGTGTVYGIGVASGAFTTSNIIPTAAIQALAVTTATLATNAATTPKVKLSTINFSASTGSNFTTASATYTDVTGVSTTYTTGATNERLFIWLNVMASVTGAANASITLSIATSGTSDQAPALYYGGTTIQRQAQLYIFDALANSTYTIKARGLTDANTLTVNLSDAKFVPTIRGFAISNA